MYEYYPRRNLTRHPDRLYDRRNHRMTGPHDLPASSARRRLHPAHHDRRDRKDLVTARLPARRTDHRPGGRSRFPDAPFARQAAAKSCNGTRPNSCRFASPRSTSTCHRVDRSPGEQGIAAGESGSDRHVVRSAPDASAGRRTERDLRQTGGGRAQSDRAQQGEGPGRAPVRPDD